MAFRYINPGLKDLFDNVAANVTQGQDPSLVFSRTSGDYFSFGSGSARSYLDIESSEEYWITFYCVSKYNAYSGNHLILKAYNQEQDKGVCLFRTGNTNNFGFTGQNDAVIVPANVFLVLNQGYHIEVYLKRGVAGKIVMWVDSEQVVDAAVDLSYIGAFDKIYFGGEQIQPNTIYLSDVVIQNTGRIGDMRVNHLNPNFKNTVNEWSKCVVPIGYYPNNPNIQFSNKRTLVLKSCQFTENGEIHAFWVMPYISASINLKFCLFRQSETGKYNPIGVTGTFIISSLGVQKITLPVPMIVQSGDYLGFYIFGSGTLGGNTIDKAECVYAAGDITGNSEIDLPTTPNQYSPCLCALFEPNDLVFAAEKLFALQQADPAFAAYGGFETQAADQSILYTPDLSTMQLGNIAVISVSAMARYEGESPAKSICSTIKSGDNTYEGAPKALTTASKRYKIDVLDKNPLDNTPWNVADLQTLQIGIKSKA